MLSLGLMMICREWILRLCSIPTFPGLIRVRRNRLHMKGNKRSLKERRIRSSCYRIGCRYRGGEELRSSVRIGVTISKDKSLISSIGVLEFAKRYMVRQVQKDLSPISLRALLTVRSTLGMCQLADLYKITNPNVLFRLAGAGFRV